MFYFFLQLVADKFVHVLSCYVIIYPQVNFNLLTKNYYCSKCDVENPEFRWCLILKVNYYRNQIQINYLAIISLNSFN